MLDLSGRTIFYIVKYSTRTMHSARRRVWFNREISKYRHRGIFGPGPRNGQSSLELGKNISHRVMLVCASGHNIASASLSLFLSRDRYTGSSRNILSRRGRLLVLFARNERTKIAFHRSGSTRRKSSNICVVGRYL